MIKNYNYVSIKIKSIDLTVTTRDDTTIGQYSASNEMSASPRQHKEVTNEQ